jgi:hypothetical protein
MLVCCCGILQTRTAGSCRFQPFKNKERRNLPVQSINKNGSGAQQLDKPSIVDVVGEYVTLRKLGREFWGLCPFHDDKRPSLSVNSDKEVFLCRSCGVGGDVVTFIQKIEHIDFKTAVRRLGLEQYRPSPELLKVKREAKTIASWARATSIKLCDALREIADEIRVCKLVRAHFDKLPAEIVQHEASLVRQWAILTDLDDDLNNPKLAIELWQQRAEIDALVEQLA